MASKDPLLQPFRLTHLTLRNRILSTAPEPAYAEDGLPKERYRLYHVERAKGGIALAMTAGSAIVAEDSAPSFGNPHADKAAGDPGRSRGRLPPVAHRRRRLQPQHPRRHLRCPQALLPILVGWLNRATP